MTKVYIYRTLTRGGLVYDRVITTDPYLTISGMDEDGVSYQFDDEVSLAKSFFEERGVRFESAEVEIDLSKLKFS